MEFELPFFPMPITRSRVMLEAASELVGMKIWSYRQARISLRDQEEGEWKISLFGLAITIVSICAWTVYLYA